MLICSEAAPCGSTTSPSWKGSTRKQGTMRSCSVTGLWQCWGGMVNKEGDRVEEEVVKSLHRALPSFMQLEIR